MSETLSPRKRKGEQRKQLMKQVKENDKKRLAKTRNKNRAKEAGKCGAQTTGRGVNPLCQRPAGWGTSHVGIGYCRYHGGNVPTHKLNSYKQDAVFMGAEKDINPYDAIMWCIRMKAGEIEWLTERMAELDKTEWVEDSIFGKQMHLWQRERTAAIELLARISKDAVSLGIAERAVRLAESYGASIARLLKGIYDELELSNKQREAWPAIIRRQLLMIESTQTISGPRSVIDGKVAGGSD